MQPVLETIERVAPTDANVLITGESGCGKGLIARLIHEARRGASAASITVNIGSLAETVFESEMFGHVKGAFTDAKNDRVGRFELADGGTLFLDEIANIPSRSRRGCCCACSRTASSSGSARRGRSSADVRVLAATNADIDGEISAGRFRARPAVSLEHDPLHLPALRERGDDILRLAQRSSSQHAQHRRRGVTAFSEPALSALRRYSWPGNVREAQSRHRARRADGARHGHRARGSAARRWRPRRRPIAGR